MAVLVSDSFNRADSATTLGTTDSYNGGTAKTWTAVTGTWGISTSQAYIVGGTADAIAVVDVAQADVKVSVTISATGSGEPALYFRTTDANNKFRLVWAAGTFYLQKFVANAKTNVASGAHPLVAGDVLRVECSGNSISVFVNNVSKFTATDAFNNTVTKHGIGNGSAGFPATRWDNFIVEDVAASGMTYTGSGTVSGVATVSATNTLRKQPTGTSSGIATDSATPVYRRNVVGTSSGIATTSASIGIITQHASGTSSGVTTATATPIQRRQALGTSSGIATNTAIPNFRRSVSVIANGSSWTYISAPSGGTSDVYYYRKKMISRFGLLK